MVSAIDLGCVKTRAEILVEASSHFVFTSAVSAAMKLASTLFGERVEKRFPVSEIRSTEPFCECVVDRRN